MLMFFHRNPAGLAAAVLTVMHGYRWGQVFWLAGLPGPAWVAGNVCLGGQRRAGSPCA